MRPCLLLLPLALVAGPALAQAPTKPPAQRPDAIQVPPELTDPAMADRLGRMMQAMTQAFLNLPIGEIEAAAEGRPVTPADRRRTVREVGRMDDPNFEREVSETIAESRVGMQASMKALAAALPAMMKGLAEASRELEKATANLPSPNYPRR
jgi:hypothetical protein